MDPDIPAAQYLRMFTDQQQYSFENQAAAIQRYAFQHGFAVTITYEDAGKSGLELKNRPGLRKLIEDVISSTPTFKAILVYDMSRWGRFQDVDESAHYDFICKAAGVPVHYCTEPFANDSSMTSTIMKSFKRVMAGEYSRELSAKVYEGMTRISRRGFRTGGQAGFGYRRMLVSSNGQLKQELQFGDRKNLQDDRVILVHGPADEVQRVRDIFRWFTEDGKMPLTIARELNRKGIPFPGIKKHEWYPQAVDRILRNPKYTGFAVYGRRTQKLGGPISKLPPRLWISTANAWTPIIDKDVFESAQRTYLSLTRNKSDQQLLDQLRELFEREGRLSEKILRAAQNNVSIPVYERRFGSLGEAFALAGYNGPKLAATRTLRRLRIMREDLVREILSLNPNSVSVVRSHWRCTPRLQVNRKYVVALHLCQCFRNKSGDFRWLLELQKDEWQLITFVARLDERVPSAALRPFLHGELLFVPQGFDWIEIGRLSRRVIAKADPDHGGEEDRKQYGAWTDGCRPSRQT